MRLIYTTPEGRQVHWHTSALLVDVLATVLKHTPFDELLLVIAALIERDGDSESGAEQELRERLQRLAADWKKAAEAEAALPMPF